MSLARTAPFRSIKGTAKNLERTAEESKKTAKAARGILEVALGVAQDVGPYAVLAIIGAIAGKKGLKTYRARKGRKNPDGT